MAEVQNASIRDPMVPPAIRTLAVEVWRRAEAMGLIKPDSSPQPLAATSDIVRLVRHIRDVGIARQPALRFDNVEVPSQAEVASLLRMIIDALESSPVAKFEWPAVSRVFEPEQLASLLGISVSSLRRYLGGTRDTPDDVAARLHFLALVIGDLAGAYNDVGIRRWFDRKRTTLDGKTPASLLSGEWNPDSPGPQRVRALAQSLVALSAT